MTELLKQRKNSENYICNSQVFSYIQTSSNPFKIVGGADDTILTV